MIISEDAVVVNINHLHKLVKTPVMVYTRFSSVHNHFACIFRLLLIGACLIYMILKIKKNSSVATYLLHLNWIQEDNGLF